MNTDLLTAAKNVISNWEKGDLAAAVRELSAAIATTESQPMPPVVVFVEGGAVTQVLGNDGKEYPCQRVVDYDCEENGDCPVCLADSFDNRQPCEECGYSEKLDNALEISLTLLPRE